METASSRQGYWTSAPVACAAATHLILMMLDLNIILMINKTASCSLEGFIEDRYIPHVGMSLGWRCRGKGGCTAG